MTSVVYNYNVNIPVSVESALLHCSCLLAGNTIAAGTTRQVFQHFARQHQTVDAKLAYLENIFKGSEGFEASLQAIQQYRDFKKIKHPATPLIINQKRLQKYLEAEFENQTREVFSFLDKLRLYSIDALATHGYFDHYHVDGPQGGVPGEKHATVAEMMELFPSAASIGASLFCLPIGLFGDDMSERWTYGDALPESLSSLSFLHTTFRLPSLDLLSYSEIHSVKLQVQGPAAAFHKAVAEWMQVCSGSEEDNASLSFFKQEVLPAAEGFQAAMDANGTLNQHVRAGNDKRKVSFALGELSLAATWRLFREKGLLPDEDWESLQLKAADPGYNRPRPVMVLDAFIEEDDSEPGEEASLLKKSLPIDE